MKIHDSLRTLAVTVWLFCTALILTPGAFAASHTWSGAVNGFWSNAGNWSAGGVPTLAETNTLIFPAGATRFTVTNDVGALKVSAFNFSGGGYVVRGASTLTVESSLINILCNGGSNTIESALSFVSIASLAINVGDTLVLSGMVSGTNGLVKNGVGQLFLRGTASNPLSGDMSIYSGEAHFQKSGGASAYNGNSILVGTTNVADPTQIYIYANDSINDSVNLDLQPSGALVMNNFSDTVNSLAMWSGTLDTGTGTLRMNSSLNLAARFVSGITWESPTLLGKLEFNGAACTINVVSNNCTVSADIVETGGATALNKTGAATLILAGTANNYTGALNIQQGRVVAGNSTALGTIAGATTVSNGATLVLSTGISSSEPLSLAGLGNDGQGALQMNGTFGGLSGAITLTGETGIGVGSAAGLLNLDGPVSGGGGLRKFGAGVLSLNGAGNNSFSGPSFVANGRLTLNKSTGVRAIGSVAVTNGASLVLGANNLIDDAATVSLYSGGLINMSNRTETIGGLNLGNNTVVDMVAGTLTVAGNIFGGAPYTTTNQPGAVIRGNLSLGGATRTFTTTNNTRLYFDCLISDGAGVGGIQQQWGSGGIHLMRSNSFTGPVSLHGYCYVSNAFAFGAPGGGVLSTNEQYGGFLTFEHLTMSVSNENLTVGGDGLRFFNTGTNAWMSPITLISNTPVNSNFLARLGHDGLGSGDLTLSGSISGPGDLDTGDGTLRLTASNSYTGVFYVAGRCVITHTNALGATNGSVLLTRGPLELNLSEGATVLNKRISALNFGVGALVLRVVGPVNLNWVGPISVEPGFQVDVPNFFGSLTLNSAITNYGNLTKVGDGLLVLAGTNANTYLGDTTVTGGYLSLSKPNGVQAVANLSVHFPGQLHWAGSEQIANGARLSLDNTVGYLNTHSETITDLAMTNGVSDLLASTGTLTLLGNIDVTGGTALLEPTLYLSAGIHHVSGFPIGTLTAARPIHDVGGSAGLEVTDSELILESSNTFTGPISLIQDAHLVVRHPSALGGTAQGVATTNWGVLQLDLPNGGVMDPEPLNLCSGINDLGFLRMPASKTNTWTGPVTVNGRAYLYAGLPPSRMIITGTITGPGHVRGGSGEVVLAGSGTNTFNGLVLDNNGGTFRLAKSPGVPALGGNIDMDLAQTTVRRVTLDAPGQLLPSTEVLIGTNGVFDLNGQSSTIRRLTGFGSVTGNGLLTITNPPAGFDTDFAGDFASTLVKQGAGKVTFNGAMVGDLLIEGGTFVRNCTGSASQTAISPGATVVSASSDFFNFGALSGAGTLRLTGSSTIVGGPLSPPTNSIFTGSIIGTNAITTLNKVGGGALTLTGPISQVSTTAVLNGTLLVNTVMTNPVLVSSLGPGNNPTLSGNGTVGPVTATGVGARVSPGATTNVPSYGKLTMASLTMNTSALLRSEFTGTNAGVNLDQLEVADAVALAGGQLEIVPSGYGALSNRYPLIKATGAGATSGNFTGLPEGGSTFSGGRSYQITYLGAPSGRDVVLTQTFVPLEPTVTGLAILTNGAFSLDATGTPSVEYAVEFRNDMAADPWMFLTNLIAHPGTGALNLIDPAAPLLPKRFYRFNLP